MQCLSKGVTGVMVGRSIVNQPFYWNQIDTVLYGKNNDEINVKIDEKSYIGMLNTQMKSRETRGNDKKSTVETHRIVYGEHNGKLYKSTVDRLIKDIAYQ